MRPNPAKPSSKEKEQQRHMGERFIHSLFALARLGDSDRIAEFLTQRGVTGVRNESTSCPVSVYLSEQSRGLVVVGTESTLLHGPIDSHIVKHPQALGAFIDAFDSGAYPKLEAKQSDFALTASG